MLASVPDPSKRDYLRKDDAVHQYGAHPWASGENETIPSGRILSLLRVHSTVEYSNKWCVQFEVPTDWPLCPKSKREETLR